MMRPIHHVANGGVDATTQQRHVNQNSLCLR